MNDILRCAEIRIGSYMTGRVALAASRGFIHSVDALRVCLTEYEDTCQNMSEEASSQVEQAYRSSNLA